MRLWTARFTNPALADSGLAPIAITLGKPKMILPYRLAAHLRLLAPAGWYFGEKDDEVFRRKYRHDLHKLTEPRVRALLEAVSAENDGRDLALLCFEDLRQPGVSCHRRMFAEWWTERTGEAVPELREA